jgi:BNR repeat-like domain
MIASSTTEVSQRAQNATVSASLRVIALIAVLAALPFAGSVSVARADSAIVPPNPTSGKLIAGDSLTQLSFDPFTNPTSQHRTQVEPDSFSNGRRVVSAFQSGRFFTGGASDIGWATSTGHGKAWRQGFLPGTTTIVGGPYASVTDPSVAFDAAHHVWLISSVALDAQLHGVAVLVSRSPNGLDWSAPVIVAAAGIGEDWDKNWTVCDNARSSPFYGHCYTEFDDFGHLDQIKMSTSTDGGKTWGAPLDAAAGSLGLGGQPVVQPNGSVIVPIMDFVDRSIFAFRSTNGGASWSAASTVSPISWRPAAGGLRDSPLPSAGIDAKGRVYVVWQDCRFRLSCASNDLVLSTSDDGINWSPVRRVPIDPLDSGADHFIPGLAVDPKTSGGRARLALTYYTYPSAACTAATCQLDAGLIQSRDGGANWGPPTELAGPMSLSWLPSTTQGVMVGDYVSTSFVAGDPKPFFAVARPPKRGQFDEAIYTTASEGFSSGQTLSAARQAPGARVAQAGFSPAAPVSRR